MKCQFCYQTLAEFPSPNLCTACGAPQSVAPTEDYFLVFGMPRRFQLDRTELERRFYQLSRALHPDRFTGASVAIQAESLARMSYVNQAYSTLKSVASTRAYLIQLLKPVQNQEPGTPRAGVSKAQASIPMELTEAWFELQESVLEDPVGAKEKLSEFHAELVNFGQNLEKQMSDIESNYDLNPSHPLLEKLEQALQTQSYLKSMERDLERLKKNAYSN